MFMGLDNGQSCVQWLALFCFVTLIVTMLPKMPLISWYQRFSCPSLPTAVTKGRHHCAWFPALFVSYLNLSDNSYIQPFFSKNNCDLQMSFPITYNLFN